MARSRRTPPLFEVLHDASRRKNASGATELKPARQPVEVAPPAPAPRPEPRIEAVEPAPASKRPIPAGDEWEQDRKISMSRSTALMLIAAVMVVVMLTWVIAFKVGESHEEEKIAAPDLIGGSGATTDVGITPPQANRAGSSQGSSQPATEPRAGGSSQPSGAAGGWVPGTDPRQPATNYLVIAVSNFRAAIRMSEFLTANGVPAAAVPVKDDVDPRAAMENNADHKVIALRGFPSKGFSRTESERKALEREVARIGQLWSRQGGGDAFREPYWDRYK